jgi:putative endonuclease
MRLLTAGLLVRVQPGELSIFMPFLVYILKSRSIDRFYCGHTSDIDKRVKQHNDPEYCKTLTTKRFAGPWELIWSEEHSTRGEAMAREKQVKKRGIQRFLKGQL